MKNDVLFLFRGDWSTLNRIIWMEMNKISHNSPGVATEKNPDKGGCLIVFDQVSLITTDRQFFQKVI